MSQLISVTELSEPIICAEKVITFLKKNVAIKEVWQQILKQKVIDTAAAAREITLTVPEIQAEVDRQRQQQGLEKVADTLVWLSDQMMTLADWEAGIHDRLITQKLAEALFGHEIEKYFAQNRLNYEQVILYQIIVPYQKLAQEIYYQIEEGEISFYEAAHLYDIDERRRYHCGYEGKICRFSLPPEVEAAVQDTPPKQVIGPLKTQQGYHLVMVTEFIPAQLTPENRQAILQKLFQEWLTIELNYLLKS